MAWGCGSAVVGYFIDRYGYDAIFIWTYVFNGLLVVLLLRKPGGSGFLFGLGKGGGVRSDSGGSGAGGGGGGGGGSGGGAVGGSESGGEGVGRIRSLEEGGDDGGQSPTSGGGSGGDGGGSPRAKPSKHRPRSITVMLSSYAAYASRRSVWQFLLMLIFYGIVMSLVEAVQFLQMEREFHLPKVCGWGVHCYDFLLRPAAPSVSCSRVDASNTLRDTNFHRLLPSPAVSQCLPMSTTRRSLLPNHHP